MQEVGRQLARERHRAIVAGLVARSLEASIDIGQVRSTAIHLAKGHDQGACDVAAFFCQVDGTHERLSPGGDRRANVRLGRCAPIIASSLFRRFALESWRLVSVGHHDACSK